MWAWPFKSLDDLLDVGGDEQALGKRAGKDADRGKLTFPGLLGVDESRRRAEQLIAEATGGRGVLGSASRGSGSLGPSCAGKEPLGWTSCCLVSNLPTTCSDLSLVQLEQLAAEMREALCNLVSNRTAHFASNLGVVELCLALHTTFDFSRDRLIWDTGHQIYPHKLITGRYHAVLHDSHQGGPDGLPQSARERIRPVHDRPCRVQRLDGAGAEKRRRPASRARKIATRWP